MSGMHTIAGLVVSCGRVPQPSILRRRILSCSPISVRCSSGIETGLNCTQKVAKTTQNDTKNGRFKVSVCLRADREICRGGGRHFSIAGSLCAIGSLLGGQNVLFCSLIGLLDLQVVRSPLCCGSCRP